MKLQALSNDKNSKNTVRPSFGMVKVPNSEKGLDIIVDSFKAARKYAEGFEIDKIGDGLTLPPAGISFHIFKTKTKSKAQNALLEKLKTDGYTAEPITSKEANKLINANKRVDKQWASFLVDLSKSGIFSAKE